MVAVVDQEHGAGWTLYNSDCVDVTRGLPDDGVHFSVYSPPFISLLTFSDLDRDMSNSKQDQKFWEHYRFLVRELYRATKPGRMTAVHCMDLPTSKLRDGFIGLQDFPGKIIRLHQEEGWIYHSRVCIRKDPVSAMQRTKSIGLLHKQVLKDSCLSRMAVADYIVALRKPGDNPEPVNGPFIAYYGSETTETGALISETGDRRTTNCPGDDWYSVAVWQRYAEPVWMDINQNDVLSFRNARDEDDERHLAPLQLTPIRRCVDLWSNPGDVVFSPFAGIGSELYCAVEMGRKAIGVELKSRHISRTSKSSYYEQAIANLRSLKPKEKVATLFDAVEAAQ